MAVLPMVLQEYPDYYEVIKRPIDMQRIQQKLLAGQFESVEDMVADFVLMFDNACKYNEPDSLIYKVSPPACLLFPGIWTDFFSQDASSFCILLLFSSLVERG